jgi:TonB-dependent receptor
MGFKRRNEGVQKMSTSLSSRTSPVQLTVSAAVALILATAATAQTPLAADTATKPGEVQASKPASPPDAQSASGDPGPLQEVVVSGIRASLANAQAIKQLAPTVVDAVTSEDIGALPDRSVVESLQRIPGVSISKFEGGNDPDHFSAEGTTIQIRGLSQVQTQVNGRDTFTAGFGRAINLADFPSELLSSIEVYKQPTAEMIEGGLGGTVNLNTLKPLDHTGFHAAFDAEVNHSDFAGEDTPVGSALLGNTWETDVGNFGVLADVSYSRLKVRSDGIQATNFQTRDGQVVNSALRNQLPGEAVAYAPIGASFRTQDTDRKRIGGALGVQWENPGRTMLLTGQFLRTQATRSWTEHTFETESGSSEYNTYPAGCQPNATSAAVCPPGFADYQYDASQVFEKGYITLPGTGWRTATSGQPNSPTPTGGMQMNLSRRDRYERAVTNDSSLNYKWSPTERLTAVVDAQYVKTNSRDIDFTSYTDTFADMELDLSGNLPVAIPHKPLNNASPNARIAGESDSQYFADPANYFTRAAMDHMDDSEGKEWAFRGDVTFDLNEDVPFLQSVQTGLRYADREQTVRYTPYNWGFVSEVWDGTGNAVYLDQAGQAQNQLFTFNDFFRGKAGAPQGWFYAGQQLNGYAQAASYFKSQQQVWITENGGFPGGWTPVAERKGVVAGTPYLPGEIDDSDETTKAAYVMLNFGSQEPVVGNVRVRGNVGVRYVGTEDSAQGSIQFPANTLGGTFAQICQSGAAPPPICARGEGYFNDLVTFSDTGSLASQASHTFHNWLPSFNLIVSPAEDLQLRLSASKQIQRPDFGFLRNFVTLVAGTGDLPVTAAAGNPYLKPAVSTQFDIGAEWYFSRIGSLTLTYFHKNVRDFFYQNVGPRDFVNNGVTETAFITQPSNYSGTGKIKGVELGYQQAFDFLPGFLSGLGAATTYAYVQSKGLPNALLSNVSDAPTATPSTGRGNLPFEGLSKHNVNVAAFYEKGPLSARVAYNWRSRFLETAVDEIFPYFPIYQRDTGQLDASVFYNITERIKVGVQGVNLTDTVTKTEQQFTSSGLIAPRSYFITDRRFSFIVRGTF